MTDRAAPAIGGRRAEGGHPRISYVPWLRLWEEFDQQVADLIGRAGAVSVAELGGGANPTATLADRVGRPIDLTVLDISAAELEHTPPGIGRMCVDLCASQPPLHERFDAVFSRMLCEHVPRGAVFHRNCFAALRPGGYAIHFFPAVTAVPFAVNRCLPTSLSERLLESLFPARRRGSKDRKFPARYSWCWGPTAAQTERYRSVGFEVVSYDVGVGHGYYERIPVLRILERVTADFVLHHPTPWLAAYVVVVLRRPPV